MPAQVKLLTGKKNWQLEIKNNFRKWFIESK